MSIFKVLLLLSRQLFLPLFLPLPIFFLSSHAAPPHIHTYPPEKEEGGRKRNSKASPGEGGRKLLNVSLYFSPESRKISLKPLLSEISGETREQPPAPIRVSPRLPFRFQLVNPVHLSSSKAKKKKQLSALISPPPQPTLASRFGYRRRRYGEKVIHVCEKVLSKTSQRHAPASMLCAEIPIFKGENSLPLLPANYHIPARISKSK